MPIATNIFERELLTVPKSGLFDLCPKWRRREKTACRAIWSKHAMMHDMHPSFCGCNLGQQLLRCTMRIQALSMSSVFYAGNAMLCLHAVKCKHARMPCRVRTHAARTDCKTKTETQTHAAIRNNMYSCPYLNKHA